MIFGAIQSRFRGTFRPLWQDLGFEGPDIVGIEGIEKSIQSGWRFYTFLWWHFKQQAIDAFTPKINNPILQGSPEVYGVVIKQLLDQILVRLH